MVGRTMRLRHAALIAALLAASCAGRNDSLPDPVVRSETSLPTMTPIPPPNLVCIPQIGRHDTSPQPRKVRHVPPRFPARDTPTRFSGTVWVGVVEIDTDGSVAGVRAVRPIKTDPPWPEWENTLVATIRQWKYEPVCVDGQPIKTELTVTVNIDF
jgi:hypothetical protein